jgi:hypothetical protein
MKLGPSVLVLVACVSKVEPETKQAEPVQTEQPAVVPDAVADTQPSGDTITVVGVIHQDGRRICDGRGNEEWVDLYYLAGFTPLVLDDAMTRAVAALHKRPVIVEGHVQSPPATEPVPNAAECPQYQARSDWVFTSEGVRIPRGTRAAEGVAAERVRAFEGLRVARAGAKLQLWLTNPFDVPLAEKLAITVHYEGCFGKPGTDAQTSVRDAALAPGQVWHVEAPALLEDPQQPRGRQMFRADSIEVRAAGEGIAFDFDAALHELGLPGVQCPDR